MSVYTAITANIVEHLTRSAQGFCRGCVSIYATRKRCSMCIRRAAVLLPARANGSGRNSLHQATLLSCQHGEHYCTYGVITFMSSLSSW